MNAAGSPFRDAGSEPRLPGPARPAIRLVGWLVETTVRAGVGVVEAGRTTARTLPVLPQVLAQLPAMAARTADVLAQVEELVARAELLADRIVQVAEHAHRVADRTDLTRAQAAAVLDESLPTLRAAESELRRLLPVLSAAADTDPEAIRALTAVAKRVEPLLRALAEVDAGTADSARTMVGQLPSIVAQMDRDLLPTLAEMRAAVPDVRELLPLVQRLEPVLVDVETRIAGLPGSSRLRRRGQKEIDEANDAADASDSAMEPEARPTGD